MTKKHRFLAILMGGILLNAAALYLIWQFLYVPIRQAHTSLTAAEIQLKELEKKARLLRELEETIEKNKADLNKISAVFLTPETVVPFLQTVESIATRTNISLDIPPSAKLADGSSSNQRSIFDLHLSGNFPNEFMFLKLLENAPYDIVIINLEANSSEKGTDMRIRIGVLTAQKS